MNIQQIYDSVAVFNEVGGSFDKSPLDATYLYLKLVREELSEAWDAFYDDNAVELLDGAADIIVVAFGLIQALEKAGFNVEEALKRVTENNLSKMPAQMPLNPQASGFSVDYNFKHARFVLKDSNGKIRKPHDFVPVELGDLVVEGFFEGQV